MIEKTAKNFEVLKQKFFDGYSGNSHIQEILPIKNTEFLPIDEQNLELLHIFAQSNPIYHNYFQEKIHGVECIVYEGDINQYWINSLKHGSSCQPFYPTWILSAYLATSMAKQLGYMEIVDIGSGDARIAYCGKILDMISIGIEIDEFLVDLQHTISNSTGINFTKICNDATQLDYGSLNLKKPAIFTGGLPQMGDILATNIIEKVMYDDTLKRNSCFVLAGSESKKQLAVHRSHEGWGHLIEKYRLEVIKKISLPTVWTFDQQTNTPYIFTVFS